MAYYSARLIFIVLIDSARARRRNLHDESVVVVRATDFRQAFRKALKVGRSMQTQYKNKWGQKVRWALEAVDTIVQIGSITDGTEISSRLHDRVSSRPVRFGTRFSPEKSCPILVGER